MAAEPAHLALPACSFLEACFLRWVLAPATDPGIVDLVTAQAEVGVADRRYKIDYEITGEQLLLAVELDGFAFHSSRLQFTYDRFRQNDLHAAGRTVVRFSYDAIRFETARCVEQLHQLLLYDPLLAGFVIENPTVPKPPSQSQTTWTSTRFSRSPSRPIRP